MASALRSVLATALLSILFAGAATQATAQTHEVPYKSLMDTAKAHAVVAAFDRASFEAAEARYPLDEGGATASVRTGNYLLWKITHLFQSDRRVEHIALPAFQETCTLETTGYGNIVGCRLTATVAVTHVGQTRRFNFVVNRKVGRFVQPKAGEDWGVVYSGLAVTLDDVVKGLAAQLKGIGAL